MSLVAAAMKKKAGPKVPAGRPLGTVRFSVDPQLAFS